MAKKKFYVVWNGYIPGVYDHWDDCKRQIDGFANARYKAFETLQAAERAFRNGYSECENQPKQLGLNNISSNLVQQPILPSIAVDAACSRVPGPMEYQGVDAATKKILFHVGPIPDGTNNVGEFLAIVHALAMLEKQGSNLPIYSDSITAIAWVRKRKANTNMVPTNKNLVLFDLIARAEKWLITHNFKNQILKWQTHVWGEIPADFGRK